MCIAVRCDFGHGGDIGIQYPVNLYNIALFIYIKNII